MDGVELSNTKLLRDRGWNAVLIEPAKAGFAALQEWKTPQEHVFDARISVDVTIDSVLAQTPIPAELDFGVIDIDGEDYWAWEEMIAYRPRVMLVEHEATSYQYRHRMPLRGTGQVPIGPIVELGMRKGYALIESNYCNCLFCLTDCLTDGIVPKSTHGMWLKQ